MAEDINLNPALGLDNMMQPTTMTEVDDPDSARLVLDAIHDARKVFQRWQAACDIIDEIYSHRRTLNLGYENYFHWRDGELDLFWSSFEIMKPAIYTRPPVPVVATKFKDRDPLKDKTAELLERSICSILDRNCINDIMQLTRDDLLFTGRGALWVTYQSDEDKKDQEVCIEHVDRYDFLHEPTRKWVEVGWVAKRAWLDPEELKERFQPTSGDAWQGISISKGHYDRNDRYDFDSTYQRGKGGVWEVWHRSDNKVYWVAEGVGVLLDSGEPHLSLCDFFPCPKPAFGTLARRSLVPIPDYERYSDHFNKINKLTARLYLLLDMVRMKGLIPAGADVGQAIEEMIHSVDDVLLIPVPQGAMAQSNEFVQWFPLAEITAAIQGLIQSRTQLIDDYYQLSGISDIMRGATEAQETLGAQQLKGQYGSVRVRNKIEELQRVAADAIRISSEVIAEKFNEKTLLDMSQMKISTKTEIQKQIKGYEKNAKQELEGLSKATEQYLQNNQVPQEGMQQVQEGYQQAQEKITQKYQAMIQTAEAEIPIEDVMELLRNDVARNFSFEVASDSTVMTDEVAEKQSRADFLQTFAGASQTLAALTATGEAGAALAGGMLNFVLGPYRVGRELDSLIDAFIDESKSMASNPQGQDQGQNEQAALAAAQSKLAEAEMAKAQAQMAKVQADAALAQAEQQRKVAELKTKYEKQQAETQLELAKIQSQNQKLQTDLEKTLAEIDKIKAETLKILSQIPLDERKQNLAEAEAEMKGQQSLVDTHLKVNSAMAPEVVIGA